MVVRKYERRDRDAVIRLFREFMKEMGDFSAYVERAILEELGRIDEYYLGDPRQGFWIAGDVVGMVGVERQSDTVAELRRMVVARPRRFAGAASTSRAAIAARARLSRKELRTRWWAG